MPRLIMKLTRAAADAAHGTIMRGKYTFPARALFCTTLLAACVKDVAKCYNGSKAAKTFTGYGVGPSDGRSVILPKMMVRTTFAKTGWINVHATPITVCL